MSHGARLNSSSDGLHNIMYCARFYRSMDIRSLDPLQINSSLNIIFFLYDGWIFALRAVGNGSKALERFI